MKGQISIAILCHILANLLQLPLATKAASDSSAERVHIRLHMPEVVRQHTHFHKVHMQQPQQQLPQLHPHLKKLLPLAPGRPHVSLLGYTTMASGTGGLAPSLMQLMATAAPPMAPTLTPNYGPALFDSYNQELAKTKKKKKEATLPSATSSYLATAPATGSANHQLLQQLFKPNIMAAITAAQLKHKDNDHFPELESATELEQNELLNGNFMAALQRELINKFGYEHRKRKKVNSLLNYRRPQKQQQQQQQQKYTNYMQDLESDEQFDDYIEQPSSTGFEEPFKPSAWTNAAINDNNDAHGYDSAVAFSGHDNALSTMPTVDEFLHDVSSSSSSSSSHAPTPPSSSSFYGNNMYDDYGPSAMSANSDSWQTSPDFSSYATQQQQQPTKSTPTRFRSRQRRRPVSELNLESGKAGKVRYIKLSPRKKRKNRIKSKRYRK